MIIRLTDCFYLMNVLKKSAKLRIFSLLGLYYNTSLSLHILSSLSTTQIALIALVNRW